MTIKAIKKYIEKSDNHCNSNKIKLFLDDERMNGFIKIPFNMRKCIEKL